MSSTSPRAGVDWRAVDSNPIAGARPVGWSWKMPRVLVVDDDAGVRGAIVDALRDAGYEVDSAPDGRKALEAMHAITPCLVLLDLMMPIMDGWEVLREMEMSPRLARIPVCVVTAHAHLAPTTTSVLPKPLRLEAMLDLVGKHCGSPAAAP
jgi:two-component system chemotaxis response regulator CheY